MMAYLDLSITAIAAIFIYEGIISPFLIKREIHKWEKDTLALMNNINSKTALKEISRIYETYKKIPFSKKEKEMQLQIIKILFDLVIATIGGDWDDYSKVDIALTKEERMHYESELDSSNKRAQELEILLRNLFEYILERKGEE